MLFRSADDMYGKTMSVVDGVIFDYFELVTRMSMAEIDEMKKKVEAGSNPMEFKKVLAKNIVSFYHGEEKAEKAEKNWEKVFSKKEIPNDLEEIHCSNSDFLGEILVKNKIISSKSEWRRLVEEKAIHDLDKKENIADPNTKITENLTLKVGKRRFVKVLIK